MYFVSTRRHYAKRYENITLVFKSALCFVLFLVVFVTKNNYSFNQPIKKKKKKWSSFSYVGCVFNGVKTRHVFFALILHV